MEEKLGEGTYGVVSKARHKSTGTIVAIKKVKFEYEDEGVPPTAIREIALLKKLKHPNIVLLYSVAHKGKSLNLVFELIKEDLYKYLCRLQTPLDNDLRRTWVAGLLLGIDYCHSRGILHRDLKPQNILVAEDGTLKIADWGLGREIEIPIYAQTHEVITLWYRCPEIILGVEKYAPGPDVWSIGCIVAELFSWVGDEEYAIQKEENNGIGRRYMPLFPGECEIDQIFKIFKLLGTPTADLWAGAQSLKEWSDVMPRWDPCDLDEWRNRCPKAGKFGMDLIHRCLTLDPLERLAVKHCLDHPYIICPDIDDSFEECVRDEEAGEAGGNMQLQF